MGNGQRKTFGTILRELRAAAGLTQRELAALAQTHQVSIARLEQDEYQPNWKTVTRLADALGANLGDFDGWKKD